MAYVDRQKGADRLKAMAGAALFQAALGYVLIVGLGYNVVEQTARTLKVFNVSEPPPPPPLQEKPREDKATKEEEGAASPPNLRAQPAPIVVPPPKVRIPVPPKLATSDRPSPAPPGNDPTAGTSNIAGPGTGSGGTGIGTGSGGAGTGPGGGGSASRARRERGGFSTSDYRRLARGLPLSATVHVRYTVSPSGRVSGCSVTRSSGRPDVDSTTCRLIEQRFVYRPARDAQGRPVAEVVNTVWSWEPR